MSFHQDDESNSAAGLDVFGKKHKGLISRMKRSLSVNNGKEPLSTISSGSSNSSGSNKPMQRSFNSNIHFGSNYENTTSTVSVRSFSSVTSNKNASTSSFSANEAKLMFKTAKEEDNKKTLDLAPTPAMYWSIAELLGLEPPKLRAHASAVYDGKMYVYGGTTRTACSDTLYVLDLDTFHWSEPKVYGTPPPPCRAHCFVVDDNGDIYLVGGGDGQTYYNHVYKFSTHTMIWTCLETTHRPSERRAHAAVIWNDGLYIFGGGDGKKALNDVHILNLKTLVWSELRTTGDRPSSRGYHSGTLVGDKVVIFGGSDGKECFGDVHVLDLVHQKWHKIPMEKSIPRLSHSATSVGSYLFIIGGHDGKQYCSELILLNLVSLKWETKRVYGQAPSPRGYHSTVLYDSRLFLFGGYNGSRFSNQVYILELSSYAYLPQFVNFTIETP
ncbi:hypothetical protein RMATCC62417_14898 [Rhizopus microsporus]|nr:hypothetical protein RMATCC62417_14898 [Rhizopus microsporus]